jgi:SAM-dependent methyltransferase
LADSLRLSFGNAAAEYELGRPEWPDDVARVGDLPGTAEVLDLGAGTGKLTRVLARRFARVIAVEPDPSMRALLRRGASGYLVLDGSAEAIPLEDGSVDGVFSGDAFHWFDWPRALEEIARVLRPGGTLVLTFYTGPWETEPPFPAEATAIAERYRAPGAEPGGPIVESGAWREPFPGSAFEELRREELRHEHVQDRDSVIAHTLSISVYASLPGEERAALADELRHVLPDAFYRTSLRAEVWWTRLVR